MAENFEVLARMVLKAHPSYWKVAARVDEQRFVLHCVTRTLQCFKTQSHATARGCVQREEAAFPVPWAHES